MSEANQKHGEAQTALSNALAHAKAAGDSLREAKRRVRYMQWGKYVKRHFAGSKETAVVYMRISRLWDDPRIQDARRGGTEPKSIQGFLDIVRNKPRPRKSSQEHQPEPTPLDFARQELRRMIADEVRQMTLKEAELAILHFYDIWGIVKNYSMYSCLDPVQKLLRDRLQTMDYFELDLFLKHFEDIWPKMYEGLKASVCTVWDGDYYGEGMSDEEKQRIRERVRARIRPRKGDHHPPDSNGISVCGGCEPLYAAFLKEISLLCSAERFGVTG